MAISRMQLVKELEPGLNALFGLEYDRYENQHTEIFDAESSDRAFEEEVMLGGFGNAEVKPEGSGVVYEAAQETFPRMLVRAPGCPALPVPHHRPHRPPTKPWRYASGGSSCSRSR